MAVGTVMPSAFQVLLDANGNPVSGGFVYSYLAGTTTPTPTYADVTLTSANTNPIVADSAGRWVAFLSPGASYKFIFKTAAGASIKTVDNVTAVPTSSSNLDITGVFGEGVNAGQPVYLSDGSGSKTPGSWYLTDADFAYASTSAIWGFVQATTASGATGGIRLGGRDTNQSSLVVGTRYFLSGTAGEITSTAPANRRDAGIADTTSSIVMPSATTLGFTTSTITSTGNQVALALPSGSGPLTIFANNASLLTLQGIAAGVDGQELSIFSIGAGQVNVNNQDGSASAANRVILGISTGPRCLAAGTGKMKLVYDATTVRWRVLEHEQGSAITPAFDSADYTGSGGTWGVGSGDIGTCTFYLKGRTLTVNMVIGPTSVQAGSSTLRRNIPGGYTANQDCYNAIAAFDNAGTRVSGVLLVVGTGTILQFQRMDAANWAVATDATYVFGQLSFDVT